MSTPQEFDLVVVGGGLAGAGKIEYFGTVSREAVDVAGFGSVGPAEL